MLDRRYNSRGCQTGIECLRQAPNQRQGVLENAVPCADSGAPSGRRGPGILQVARSQRTCSIELFAGPTILKSYSQSHKSGLSHDNIALSRVGSVAFRSAVIKEFVVDCLHRPKTLLRTSGQNSFATLKNASRAICCPHFSAVFPNDRLAAG